MTFTQSAGRRRKSNGPRRRSSAVVARAIWTSNAKAPTARPPPKQISYWKSQDEILVVSDLLCSAGGVVLSYFDSVQDLQQLFWQEEEAIMREYQLLDRAFDRMLARARTDEISHRTAAMTIAVEKGRTAMNLRGLFP